MLDHHSWTLGTTLGSGARSNGVSMYFKCQPTQTRYHMSPSVYNDESSACTPMLITQVVYILINQFHLPIFCRIGYIHVKKIILPLKYISKTNHSGLWEKPIDGSNLIYRFRVTCRQTSTGLTVETVLNSVRGSLENIFVLLSLARAHRDHRVSTDRTRALLWNWIEMQRKKRAMFMRQGRIPNCVSSTQTTVRVL